ncbi:hypothetical protein M0804_002794 [Polistes exclamans]|nr:hypothetical protein M0804_002794 [Polistes exclamans]
MGQESSSRRLLQRVVSEGTRILISTSTLWIRSEGLQGDVVFECTRYNTLDSSVFLFKLGSNFVEYETSRMGRRIVGVFSKDHRTEPHVSRTSGVANPRELELT